MLRQALYDIMLAIDTAFLETLSRHPWNQPPDLRSLKGAGDPIEAGAFPGMNKYRTTAGG